MCCSTDWHTVFFLIAQVLWSHKSWKWLTSDEEHQRLKCASKSRTNSTRAWCLSDISEAPRLGFRHQLISLFNSSFHLGTDFAIRWAYLPACRMCFLSLSCKGKNELKQQRAVSVRSTSCSCHSFGQVKNESGSFLVGFGTIKPGLSRTHAKFYLNHRPSIPLQMRCSRNCSIPVWLALF